MLTKSRFQDKIELSSQVEKVVKMKRRDQIFLAVLLGLFISCGGGSKSGRGASSPPSQGGNAGNHTFEYLEQLEPDSESGTPPAAPGPGEDGNPPEPRIK